MHEMSLIANLLNKIEHIAREQQAERVTRVKVVIGALAHISGDHFREHFVDGTRGTLAQDAVLDIVENPDTEDPNAQEILLDSIEVEQPDDVE